MPPPTTLEPGSRTTLVAGARVFDVRVDGLDPAMTMTVGIVVDGRPEWTVEVAGWCPIGLDRGGAFLWSAREVIVLPADAAGTPSVIAVDDDDLRRPIRRTDGWVLVCELSVRRLVGERQTDRVELPDVVMAVTPHADEVGLRLFDDFRLLVVVDGEKLVVT